MGGAGCGLRDLERLAGQVAGRSLSKLFQRYVTGSQRIPVEAYLARLGLEVRLSGRRSRPRYAVQRRAQASPRQSRLRRTIFGVE